MALQYKLLNLFDAMIFTADFPEGVRAALKLRGFEPGAGRQPLSTDQQVNLRAISDNLQCLLAEQGFVNEPLGGCPAGSPRPVDSHDVTRIVETVVAELRRQGAVSP